MRLNRLKRLLLAKIWPSSVTLCSSFNVAWYQSSCCAGERALALGVVFKGTHIYITTWYGDTSDTLKWILSLHTCLENGQCPFLCVLWVLSPWYVTQNMDDFCANQLPFSLTLVGHDISKRLFLKLCHSNHNQHTSKVFHLPLRRQAMRRNSSNSSSPDSSISYLRRFFNHAKQRNVEADDPKTGRHLRATNDIYWLQQSNGYEPQRYIDTFLQTEHNVLPK